MKITPTDVKGFSLFSTLSVFVVGILLASLFNKPLYGILLIPVLIGSAVIYFFLLANITMILNSFGKSLVRWSEYYPEFWYRPNIKYSIDKQNNTDGVDFYLVAKSSNFTQKANLQLSFAKIHFEQNAELFSELVFRLTTSGKLSILNVSIDRGKQNSTKIANVNNNQLSLFFLEYTFNIPLVENFTLSFNEYGKYKNRAFPSKRESVLILAAEQSVQPTGGTAPLK